MTVEALLLTATTVIALVSVAVATVAVRSVRRLSAQIAAASQASVVEVGELVAPTVTTGRTTTAQNEWETTTDMVPVEFAARGTAPRASVVEGRVVVPPTQTQVVRTALGRPGVRLNIFAHGLARALRAENRDRIVALVRREYRHRRRERLRAGRQAVRMARPNSAPSTDRLHEHLMEPRPASLSDRMIGS